MKPLTRPARFPRGCGWLFATLSVLLAGCASTPKRPAVALEPPKPYLRIERSPDRTLALQAVSRQLTGPKRSSPVIWLVSASHIGESNYFATLQQQLDICELVLFEGVGGRPQKRQAGAEAEGQISSLQGSLAQSLGLVFQLDAIDYDRRHFVNSDVGLEQIRQMMNGGLDNQDTNSATGASTNSSGGAAKGMQELMGMMDGSSFLGLLMQTAVKMISVSPRLQATVKVVFIETLGSLEGDIAQAKGLPEELQELMKFIIKERNQIVLKDLKAALDGRKRPKTIAIFYGAGHMHDLERRICEELNYRPAGDTWQTAFAINLRAAGISDAEVNVVRSMVKWQMEQLQKGGQ